MPRTVIFSDVHATGSISADGNVVPSSASISDTHISSTAAIARSKMAQNVLEKYGVPLTAMRVHNDMSSLLPGTAAMDDLGLIEGTFGTTTPVLQTSDAKATTVTQYARFSFIIPPEYDDAQTVQLRIHGGMETTVSDDTATVDVECYEGDREGGLGSDLCSTAAITAFNSLTHSDHDFTIDAAGLVAGDELDIRITVAITDAATGTAVIGQVGSVALLMDTRG